MAAGLILEALALFLLSYLAPTEVDIRRVLREISVIDPEHLKPEPLERFLYVTGVLLLPFSLGCAYLGVRRLLGNATARRIALRLMNPVAWLITPSILVLLFFAGFVENRTADFFQNRTAIRDLIPGGATSLAAAVLLALGAVASSRSRYRGSLDRVLRFLLPGTAAILLFAILAFTVFDQEHIRNIPNFWTSFNAVFYSVVQVFHGKELLVDFTNQYGLYPHFVEPIFSLVGLSVFGFTFLMGLLNCLAFYLMYRFLAKETGDRLMAFLGLATIVFFCYFAGRVASQDQYLQYHPIRILFPAISLLVARAFAHRPSLRLGASLAAVGAVAFLWNPDTGTIVLASGLLLAGYDALLRRRPQELPQRLLASLASACAIVAAFSVFLKLRFGEFPDYIRLFIHLKAFYASGVAMLPMPRFGLWVPVLVVYAAALLLSLAALREGEDTPRARIHFFLSVLGLGLFSYYQGRSAVGNLMAAGYPAVLIVVLLTGDLWRRLPFRPPAAEQLLALALLTLLSFSVPALAAVTPVWIGIIAEKVRATRSGEEGELLGDARFLRTYVRPGQEVVIMSYHSGLFHLLTRTTNPLDIPGDSELVLRKDYDRQADYANRKRGIFVVDKTTIVPSAVDMFRRTHRVYHENPHGNLIVFPVATRPLSR